MNLSSSLDYQSEKKVVLQFDGAKINDRTKKKFEESKGRRSNQ